MQEWLLTGPRQLELVDYEDPPLADNEIRVRSIVTGVKRGTETDALSRRRADAHQDLRSRPAGDGRVGRRPAVLPARPRFLGRRRGDRGRRER